MSSIIPYETTEAPAPTSTTTTPFLGQVFELLSNEVDNNGGLIRWHSDGKGFSLNCGQLEEYLKSSQSQFEQSTVETFIGQLKSHGFQAIALESNSVDNDEELAFLAFAKAEFTRDGPQLATTGPRRATKPFYCAAEKHYLKYKRVNDPCYKLMSGPKRNAFDKSKDRFRAVLAQQKLKRIVSARQEAAQLNPGADVFHDLLPNETNIAIQMGAIAGKHALIDSILIDFVNLKLILRLLRRNGHRRGFDQVLWQIPAHVPAHLGCGGQYHAQHQPPHPIVQHDLAQSIGCCVWTTTDGQCIQDDYEWACQGH